MKKWPVLIIAISLGISLSLAGCTQNEEMKGEIEKLKEGQENIVKEIGEVKQLLQARAPAPAPQRAEFKEAVIDVGDEPFMGEKLAKVTLIEFLDFQ